MSTWIADVSHYKAGFDLVAAKTQGVGGILAKATQGNNFIDPQFAAFHQAAVNLGIPFGAYHYQDAAASISSQVANVERAVPKSVSVSVDVEAGSGNVATTRLLVAALRSAGYRVPLTYLPKWYWTSIGSPSLAGLPPLWASRYPSNTIGSPAALYAQVPASYWNPYGGGQTAMLQFTSSAALANFPHGSIDISLYPGTPAQFAALLGGDGEEDMANVTDDQLALLVEAAHSVLYGNATRTAGPLAGQLNDIHLQLAKLSEAADSVLFGKPNVRNAGPLATTAYQIQQQIAAVSAAVAGLSSNSQITPDQLTQIINDAVAKNIQITGTVDITSKETSNG